MKICSFSVLSCYPKACGSPKIFIRCPMKLYAFKERISSRTSLHSLHFHCPFSSIIFLLNWCYVFESGGSSQIASGPTSRSARARTFPILMTAPQMRMKFSPCCILAGRQSSRQTTPQLRVAGATVPSRLTTGP